MKQYFKSPIKTIAATLLSPLGFPLLALGLAGLFASCETTDSGGSETQNARNLDMHWPMSEPLGYRLVALETAIPSIKVDLRYAKPNNVARKRLYARSMLAMLDEPTAKKLVRAQKELLAKGFTLKVWDAYRPPEAHLKLWKLSGKSGYVADPRWGWSKHCSGRAIDVTLADAKTGREVPMPTNFDDFSKKASSNYIGPSPEVRTNLSTLKTAMKNAGFIGIEMEWWHFENSTRNQENLPPIYLNDEV